MILYLCFLELFLINMTKSFSLNCVELLDYQPNRYPFLMIDYVTDVMPGSYARGYKNLTMNEWYFPKHFPGHPNMPGTSARGYGSNVNYCHYYYGWSKGLCYTRH